MLAAYGQALASIRVDIGPKGIGPGADVDRVLARLTSVMAAAAGVGCRLVCLDIGPLPPAPPDAGPAPRVAPELAGPILIPAMTEPVATPPQAELPADPAFVAQVDGVMHELGRVADRHGVVLAMRSDLAGFAELDRLLRAADCPWLGVDLDPVAVLRDAWDMDRVLSRLGTLVRHVRARDALAGADRRTRPAPIGMGSTDWRELLADLDDGGYRGWVTVDTTELADRAGSARSAVEYLARL
mgnify:CR=1 FL=1